MRHLHVGVIALVAAMSMLLSAGALADSLMKSAAAGSETMDTKKSGSNNIEHTQSSDFTPAMLSGSLGEVAVSLEDLSYLEGRLLTQASKAELETKTDVDGMNFNKLEPDQYVRHEFARFEEAPKAQ